MSHASHATSLPGVGDDVMQVVSYRGMLVATPPGEGLTMPEGAACDRTWLIARLLARTPFLRHDTTDARRAIHAAVHASDAWVMASHLGCEYTDPAVSQAVREASCVTTVGRHVSHPD